VASTRASPRGTRPDHSPTSYRPATDLPRRLGAAFGQSVPADSWLMSSPLARTADGLSFDTTGTVDQNSWASSDQHLADGCGVGRCGAVRLGTTRPDSQHDSQPPGQLRTTPDVYGILPLAIELYRTSMDGSGRKTRGLQNRLRPPEIQGRHPRENPRPLHSRASSSIWR
jgi:hypothetical protein